MPFYLLNEEPIFPPASDTDAEGLLALGGDLSVERLTCAYKSGIFPWYEEGSPILWWSPDPRMVLFPGKFKLKKSLRNTINKNIYQVRFDTQFEAVIRSCASAPRNGQDGTWITEDMIQAYINLHRAGYCHSVETFFEDKLVGGLYGVSLGSAFFGESMFHHMTDASKVALYHLVERCKRWGFDFIDAQQETEHLKSLGAESLARDKFLSLLALAVENPTRKGKWEQ
jgi:leucyl/phenylalanyl-tRNA---protein transferase